MFKKNTELFTFRMPKDMRKEVDYIAVENDATQSEVVRYALRSLIASQGNE